MKKEEAPRKKLVFSFLLLLQPKDKKQKDNIKTFERSGYALFI